MKLWEPISASRRKFRIKKESLWDQGNILTDFVLTYFPTLHLGGGKLFLRPYFLTVVPLEAKLLGLLSRHSPRVRLYKICFQLIINFADVLVTFLQQRTNLYLDITPFTLVPEINFVSYTILVSMEATSSKFATYEDSTPTLPSYLLSKTAGVSPSTSLSSSES